MKQRLSAGFLGIVALCGPVSGASPGVSGADLQSEVTCDMWVPGHILVPCTISGEKGYGVIDNGSPVNIVPQRLLGSAARGPAGAVLPIQLGGRDFRISCSANAQLDGLLTELAKLYPDTSILGILGSAFLKDFTVRLDYLDGRLTLFPPGTCALPSGATQDDTHVLLDFASSPGGHLFIEACEVGPLKGRLHLDLGSPTFNFDRELASKAGIQGDEIPECRAGAMRFRHLTWMNRNFRDVFPHADLIGELGNAQLLDTVVTLHTAGKKLEIERDPKAACRRRPLGIRLGQDGCVAEVVADSTAEKMGIQVGDRLLSVNGRGTPGNPFVACALRLAVRGPCATVLVRRDGKETPLSCPLDAWVGN